MMRELLPQEQDLVLDEPAIDVEDDLEVEPPTPFELLMLPGETKLQTVRRLIDEAERERKVAMYGPTWHRKISLATAKLPVKK